MDSISVSYFTGGSSFAFIYAALLWAVVGVALWKFLHYTRREKDGVRHGIKFDLVYWVEDNIVPLLGNLLFTFAFIRFTSDIVSYLNVEVLKFGSDPMFIYILFGFLQQVGIDYVRKKFRKPIKDAA